MARLLSYILIMIAVAETSVAQRDSVRIAFYNCENYFDSFRDTSINDVDYTPDGNRRWTYHRFLTKRNNIFKVIASMSDVAPPEIIGVCEVENRFVLNQLVYETPLSKFSYAVVHENSSDRRGIDVALLYQRNRLHLLTYKYFNPNAVDTALRTRSILYAKFKWGELDTLHVFVNHFPSKLGGRKADKRRVLVASFLKSKIDSVAKISSTASIIVTGDFNDTPPGDAMSVLADDGLVNLALPLHEQRMGSIKFDGSWELIDQFVVSKSLLNGETPVRLKDGMQIYSAPFLLEEDTAADGQKPKRTFVGFRYNGGFSDHLPVFIKLVRLF